MTYHYGRLTYRDHHTAKRPKYLHFVFVLQNADADTVFLVKWSNVFVLYVYVPIGYRYINYDTLLYHKPLTDCHYCLLT